MRLLTPTDEDLVLADRMADAGVEFVAVSFVRSADDVRKVAAVVDGRAELVAKIETSAALDDLAAILEVSDAIMVARGDLGIDCPLEDIPHLQKSIIRQCVEFGIPVITATQMLESMVTAPSPTRAEVTDIANAIFDGTDALMLSGETAIGHDPALVVSTMSTIAERAEAEAHYRQWAARLGRVQRQRWDSINDQVTAAISHAASITADDISAKAILCCTSSGRTAKAMARFRPSARLIGLSPNERTVNALNLSWGVLPVTVDVYASTDDIVWHAVERSVREGYITPGDVVVVVAGSPERSASTAADVLRIVHVQ
jgi:pyruvate kinase